MTYCQYLIKVGRRKKIEKYFKSSCLRELKTIGQFYPYFCKLVLVYSNLFNEIKIKLAGQI